MRQSLLLFLISMLGSLLFFQEASASGFDLEVSVSVPNPNPAIYTNVPVTVTAKNTGTTAGTGIQIRVGVCGTNAFSFVQQNQLVWANTGNSATGTWDWLNQRWTIPALAPGQTATLNFTLFTLTTNARSIQVFTQASSPDVDSSPGNLPTANGLWVCTATEDDEAVLTLNGGAVPCAITISSISNIQCNDNGTPSNPADDKFSFTLTATNPAPSTGFKVIIQQTGQVFNGTYGSPMTIPNLSISLGLVALNLTDNVTGGCSASINVSAPAPCSTSGSLPDFEMVSFFAVQPVPGGGSVVVEPNDPVPAGTTLNFPDHFAWLTFPVIVPTFDVVIAAYLSTDATLSTNDVFITSGTRNINAAVQNYGFTEGQVGVGVIPANTPPGNYFLILKHDATDLIAESNEANNFKATPIVVTAAPSGRIDLSLSMNQQTPNPVIYSHYLTTLTIANDGQEPATGVKVKWVKPAGVVYTGGNEYVASQGSFNPNGDQVWTVGTIPNAGVASLTVSYFLLQNGAPSTYAQVIAADQQDVDSTPNNGTPPTLNEDDEAATGGSAPPVLKPDLKLSNLVINNSPIRPGQVLTYNFNIANVGNGAASADFNVKAWISTTSYLTSSSIQDGIVPTGNFPAGFEVQSVPGASTLPGDLAEGQYYLLLKVDADETIQESVETNNWLTASFIVLDEQQPGECDDFVGTGVINCTSNAGNGQLEIIYQPNGELYQATLDGAGQVVSDNYIGQELPEITYSVAGTELVKWLNNSEVYRVTIPPSLANQYERFIGFTEYQGGYLLFAFKQLLPAPAPLVVIKATQNFSVLKTNMLNIGQSQIQFMAYPLQISPNESAFIFYDQYQGFGYNRAQLIVLDDDLKIQSAEVLAQNHFGASARLSLNPCGQYSLDIFRQLSYCKFGSCYEHQYRDGYFENGSFVIANSYLRREISSFGIGTRDQVWNLATQDGGNLMGTHSQPLQQNTSPINNVIHLKKTLGNAIQWEKDVTVSNASAVRRLAMSMGELVFLSEKIGGVFVETLSCLEATPPPTGCAAINITTGTNSLTIAGATAPHVLIKVFNPNWTLNFQCLDNCANPLTINNLNAGTYHLQVKLLTAGWEEICYLEKDVNVSSFGPGGGTGIAHKEDRQRLVLDRFYPSPTSYQVTVDVFSPVEQAATLDFYDQLGRPVHSMKVQLEKGNNPVQVLVFDWKSGAYNVIARGEETGLPAYGRFLKVWEE